MRWKGLLIFVNNEELFRSVFRSELMVGWWLGWLGSRMVEYLKQSAMAGALGVGQGYCVYVCVRYIVDRGPTCHWG